jgi:hypothetical protein
MSSLALPSEVFRVIGFSAFAALGIAEIGIAEIGIAEIGIERTDQRA